MTILHFRICTSEINNKNNNKLKRPPMWLQLQNRCPFFSLPLLLPHPALAPHWKAHNNNIHHHSGLSYLLSRLFSEAELAAWAGGWGGGGGSKTDREWRKKERPLYLLPGKKKEKKILSIWEFIIAAGVNFKTDTDGLVWEGKMRDFIIELQREREH